MRTTEGNKILSFRVPESLYRQFKIKLAVDGKTVQHVLQTAVEKYTDNILDEKTNP